MQKLEKYIDHTNLKPDATTEDIKKLCADALKFNFASVCIHPHYVVLAYSLLKDSEVAVCTVVGFPLGANTTEVKTYEAKKAIDDGASELDMVINIGALKEGLTDRVYEDIKGVVEVCVANQALCKVIIEAALLSDDEKITACRLAQRAGAHFVKTSTGFGPGGATIHDVELMYKTVGSHNVSVKAAGGIRTYHDAKNMIEAGATRIGASAGVMIVTEARKS